MQRTAVKDLTLSNGLKIPKGERVWVDVAHMWTHEYYKNPDEFNPYRFKDLRGTDKEHICEYRSSPDTEPRLSCFRIIQDTAL